VSVLYAGLAISSIGVDSFKAFWRPQAIFEVELTGGTRHEFDSSLSEKILRSEVINAYRQDASALVSAGRASETEDITSHLEQFTADILKYIGDENSKRHTAAVRALALVLVPPFILFFAGGLIAWVSRGFRRSA
jgi:hypothetical protein